MMHTSDRAGTADRAPTTIGSTHNPHALHECSTGHRVDSHLIEPIKKTYSAKGLPTGGFSSLYHCLTDLSASTLSNPLPPFHYSSSTGTPQRHALGRRCHGAREESCGLKEHSWIMLPVRLETFTAPWAFAWRVLWLKAAVNRHTTIEHEHHSQESIEVTNSKLQKPCPNSKP